MNNAVILQEAFKQFELLDEDTMSLSDASSKNIEDAQEFIDTNDALQMLDVIDPEAHEEEDLKDSYVNKIIIDCNVCHSKIYKNIDELNFSEDHKHVNENEECPYCFSTDGFTIIGQVAPFSETEINVEVEPKEEAEETELEDDTETADESLKEGLENLDIETEHDKIHVEAEEKVDDNAEMLAPISDEVKDEIEEVQEDDVEESTEDEEDIDYDFEDFDEESFDELGESYLTKVYENVNSFRTSSVSQRGNSLIVEGVIKFKSGNNKNTKFMFEALSADRNGGVVFKGFNENITKGKKSFTLKGNVAGNKLIVESLNYNYRQKDSEGQSVRVYGTVKR